MDRKRTVVGSAGVKPLRSALGDAPPDRFRIGEVIAALRHPWCWPASDDALLSAARRLASDPQPAPPGHVVLLAVAGARTTLYRFRPGRSARFAPSLHGSAIDAVRRARQLAAAYLPILPVVRRLERDEEWGVEFVARLGDGYDERLEGGSFGVAMLLANASYMLDVAVPSDLAATACVEADGSVGGVDGLRQKLKLVVESGLGIRRLIVASTQKLQAEKIRDELGGAVEILGASTVGEAVAFAFDDLERRIGEYPEPKRAQETASEIFRLTVAGTGRLVSWRGVVASAQGIERSLSGRSDEASARALWEARVAKAIAQRHEGQVAVIASLESEFERYPQAIRTRLWAHVVQSAADCNDDEAKAAIAQAHPRLPDPLARHADDLRLAGALGRAYAAIGSYQEAFQLLDEACRGWREIQSVHESSYALSELARVAGLIRTVDVEELERGAWRSVIDDPHTTAVSTAFAYAALARAYVQRGEPQRALALLAQQDRFEWELMPPHLRWARARWRARALDLAGSHAEAERARTELALHGGDHVQVHLAGLDVAIARGEDVDAAFAKLRALGNRDVDRVIARTERSLGDVARAVADEYRY